MNPLPREHTCHAECPCRAGGEPAPDFIDAQYGQSERDWHAAYKALMADANEVYSTVFVMLSDPAAPYDDLEDRVTDALNELREASKRLDAREIFDAQL